MAESNRKTVEVHRDDVEGDSTAPSVRRTEEARVSVRRRTMDVLNGWDRGIDNASEHVGDAITAGFRVFWKQLFSKKKSGDSPRESLHHAA